MPTEFDEDRSDSKGMAAVFRHSKWRQPPYGLLVTVLHFEITYAFYIGSATFPRNLMRIDQTVIN